MLEMFRLCREHSDEFADHSIVQKHFTIKCFYALVVEECRDRRVFFWSD